MHRAAFVETIKEAAVAAVAREGGQEVEPDYLGEYGVAWTEGTATVTVSARFASPHGHVSVSHLPVEVAFHSDGPDSWVIDSAAVQEEGLADIKDKEKAIEDEAAARVTLSRLTFNWHLDGVELILGADHPDGFTLGMVENDPFVIGEGWRGEDCVLPDVGVCHEIKIGPNKLTQTKGAVGKGRTRFAQEHAGCLSFILRHESGQCWVWGKAPDYYSSDDCVAVNDTSIPDSCSLDWRLERLGKKPKVAPKPLPCIPASKCCEVCSSGKACGDACIQPQLDCHKGWGCACDASRICP